jgi:hypothetical protein
MAGSRVSGFSVLLGLAILTSAAASAWYISKAYQNEAERKEIERQEVSALPDPLVNMLAAAAEYIRDNHLVAARDLLRHAAESYPETPVRPEIRRLLGRINVDLLFTDDAVDGKTTYVVEEAGSLAQLAERLETSTEYLLLANGKTVEAVEAQEELQVYPMRFTVTVDPGVGEVAIERDGEFFASYPLLGMELPAGVSMPFPSEVRSKYALLNGKRIEASEPEFEKGVRCIEMGHYGVVLRPPPESGEVATGFFMNPEDLDELSLLLRPNSKVHFGKRADEES